MDVLYPRCAGLDVHKDTAVAGVGLAGDGTFYRDLGADHFRRATPEVQASRAARQIAKLGFTCTILPTAEMEVSV